MKKMFKYFNRTDEYNKINAELGIMITDRTSIYQSSNSLSPLDEAPKQDQSSQYYD